MPRVNWRVILRIPNNWSDDEVLKFNAELEEWIRDPESRALVVKQDVDVIVLQKAFDIEIEKKKRGKKQW